VLDGVVLGLTVGLLLGLIDVGVAVGVSDVGYAVG